MADTCFTSSSTPARLPLIFMYILRKKRERNMRRDCEAHHTSRHTVSGIYTPGHLVMMTLWQINKEYSHEINSDNRFGVSDLLVCPGSGTGVWHHRPPQAPSVAKMAPAGPIAVGGPWNEFSFTSVGSLARGCAPADPGGLGCVPSSSGNSHFVGAPPWNFVAPSDGLTLTVTDAFLKGDSFEVLDMGVPIGVTSAVPTNPTSCGSDPVPCLADATLSHGVFNLGPGPQHHDQGSDQSVWNWCGLLPGRREAGTSRLLSHCAPRPIQTARGNDPGSVRKRDIPCPSARASLRTCFEDRHHS